MLNNELHPVDVTIVIVNYNVKEYLSSLLQSIIKAEKGLNLEIIVVDNASTDGSVEFLKPRYPFVHFIENDVNFGFGKANNQAIKIATGKFTLLINPDTLISEDTLTTMVHHLENSPKTGAAGCKILNPDGTFAPESRRSVPTPISSLWKMLGLTRLFSNSRAFGDYYLSWVDENKAGPVPVLSGAFMFFRTELLRHLGGFDERFFMYGEDIDLCYRLSKTDNVIDYIPSTSIIHYKGESTKKENLDYVITFNKAMFLFFNKHYSYAYTFLIRFFVFFGIIIRGCTSYLTALFRKSKSLVTDLTVINLCLGTFFIYKYDMPTLNIIQGYDGGELIVHASLSIFYVAFSKFYDIEVKNKVSIGAVAKSIFLSFSGVALITYFLHEFSYSQFILLSSGITSVLILAGIRILGKRISRSSGLHYGRVKPERMVVVGIDSGTDELIKKIRKKVTWNYEIVGIIAQQNQDWIDEIEHVPVVGRTDHIADLVKFRNVDQLLFSLSSISNKEILNIMSQLQSKCIVCKVVPDSMDYMIGKSNVEYFEDIPVVGVELPYISTWNQFMKRNMDFWLASFILLVGLPYYLVAELRQMMRMEYKSTVNYNVTKNHKESIRLYIPYEKNKWLNRYLFVKYIWMGQLSWVGAPLVAIPSAPVYYKPGLTGLRQINEKRVFREEEKERFEIYYVQNYSISMDIHVILSTIIGRDVKITLSDEYEQINEKLEVPG